jgi:UDP-N-acetylmuramyl pentapeptide phosphotransferase/UDP-N-acetylglucosamine-1-phosphate transferase
MGTIASFVIAFLALTALYFQPDVALMAFLFAGALVGFLAFNYPPATMFLGESGSVLIGFVIAVFAVIAGSKVATALLVVGLPAIDMFAVITHRLKRRNPLMKGDRLHLHFKLQDRGFKDESILFIYWATCLAFGLSTLIFESWQKLIALAVLLIATAIGIIVVSSKPYAK